MRRLLSIVCITLLTSITSFGGIVFAVGNFELPLSESIEIGDTANHVGVGIAERLVNIQINPNNLS